MMLTNEHFMELKNMIDNPTSLALHTIALWILMLDSYGIDLSVRISIIINEALQSKGTFRAKA